MPFDQRDQIELLARLRRRLGPLLGLAGLAATSVPTEYGRELRWLGADRTVTIAVLERSPDRFEVTAEIAASIDDTSVWLRYEVRSNADLDRVARALPGEVCRLVGAGLGNGLVP